MMLPVRRFTDEEAWIRAIVSDFEAAVRAAIDRRQSAFHANLSGGTTPEPVYKALAANPSLAALAEHIAIHLWVGDERDVPVDSPQRNGRMIAVALEEGVSGGAAAFKTAAAPRRGLSYVLHLWPEGVRATACAAYSREIREALGPMSVFDLAMLGMGEDGHTAGLFSMADIGGQNAEHPVEDVAVQSREVLIAVPTTAPSEPKRRMTLTASLLRRSRATMVLVRGRKKAATLKAVASGALFPIALATGMNAEFYYLET